MADRDDIIESLRIRIESESRSASNTIADLVGQLDGLKKSLESLQGLKISNFFTPTMARNAAWFSTAVDAIDVDKLKELSTLDLSNVRIAFGDFAGIKETVVQLAEICGTLQDRMDHVNKTVSRIPAIASKATAAIRQQAHAARAHHKSFSLANTALGKFFNTVKRIAFYRAIRSMIREVVQGFGEGIKNMYYWSQAAGTSFAPAMDRLATALAYLKNGFASMWSPLIEHVIIPAIDKLIEKLVDLFNLVQEGFARLVGAETWTKALKYPVQFADSTEGATKAAKALHNVLMGFDELNVINTPNDSSGGAAKAAEDYSSMFKTMKTQLKGAKSIGERLADLFNKLFENPEKWGEWGEKIAGWVTSAFDNAIDFFANVNWEDIGSSISEFATKFLDKLSSWFDDTDNWTKAIDTLTTAICKFIEGVHWDELSKSLASLTGKIALAIPSQVLSSLESGSTVLATIFDQFGMGGAAQKMRDFASEIKGVREEYEGVAGETAQLLDEYLGKKPNANGEYENNNFWQDLINATKIDQSVLDKRKHPYQQRMDAIWDEYGDSNKTTLPQKEKTKYINDVFEPIYQFFRDNPTPITFVSNIFEDTKKWVKENITDPIKKTMKENPTPLQFVSNLIGGRVSEWVRTNITDPVMKFFESNPTPIKFISNLVRGLSDWIRENITDPIKRFFEQNPTPIKFIANIIEDIRTAWNNFTSWLANKRSEIKFKVPDLVSLVSTAWNKLRNWWSTLSLPSFNIPLPHLSVTSGSLNPMKWFSEGLPHIDVTWYAKGGFPEIGQPFFMGEGGVPEMLGRVNGRTAVVGGAEITGIADAVRASGAREEQLLQTLIAVLQAKDFSFTPNAASGRMINEALLHYAGVTG